MRWRSADDDGGQAELFEEEAERHVGRGEYRGLEFLHVRAQRLINEVPGASRMPFRFTINPYRGCSHACVYCAAGDTPILMADGRTRSLADLRPGDFVYGTVREGAYRRYAITPVLDQWATTKPAYRLALADGTVLVTSGDHRFLTGRGWKHVTGADHGRLRRPHLTLNDKLMGTGRFASAPEHGACYRSGYLCGLLRGDAHIGSYHYPRPGRRSGWVHRFRLALVDLDALRRVKDYLIDIGVRTDDFLFKAASGQYRAMYGIRNQSASGVAAVRSAVEWPERPNEAWAKGFLAGVFDAEGSYSCGILRISHKDPVIIHQIATSLRRFGFASARDVRQTDDMVNVQLLGGLREHLRFFQFVDPAISSKRSIAGRALKSNVPLHVESIEPLGLSIPLYDITTGTGDFIADGVVSHNCFARPTHEFLGMNSGEDFDRRIVVKVNAVERVRAELAPGRWAGAHIAMGTNTDPYQRCEGKYRLTQGIVSELSKAANPFSILTKSTLILRDFDLLAEAASRTSVRANFSIGTLDDEVWKSTEPGTPHPLRRLEAVAKLNEAGIPCGVLVAPVLPGLSDRPEQLEAVVKGCVDAGAVSITAIPLHLRPGVKEHYLGWLLDERPELMDVYRGLYKGAYTSRRDHDELTALVRRLVERHGGRSAEPRQTRSNVRARPAPPPPRRPEARQLDLGM